MINLLQKTLLGCLLLASANAFGASTNKYWIGSAGDNFTDDTKWSTTSGGTNDTTTPGATDIANFTSGGNTNCNFSAAVDVAGFVMATGYTQTIAQSTYTLTVGADNFSQSDGIFTGGSGAITINGNWTLGGGTFTSTSVTLTCTGTFTRSAGTFTHNSGTVSFTGLSQDLGCTHSFYDVTINKTGVANFERLTAALTVAHDLTLTQGNFQLKGFNCTVSGTFTVQANGYITLYGTETVSTPTLATGASVKYLGDGSTNVITLKNWSYKRLEISDNDYPATPQNFTLGEAHTECTDVFVYYGILDINGYNLSGSTRIQVDGTGEFILQGVETVTTPIMALNAGSIIRYKGDNVASTKTCQNWTYSNITFNDANTNKSTFKFGETHTGIETFTVTLGTFSQSAGNFAITCTGYTQTGGTFTGGTAALTVNGAFALSTGTFTSTAGTLTVGGNFTRTSGTFTHNSGTVNFNDGNATLTCTSSFQTITVNKTAQSNTLTLGAALTAANALTVTTGKLCLAGFNLTVTGIRTIATGATLQLKGTETVSTPGFNANSIAEYVGDNTGTTITMQNWTYENLTINDTNVTPDTFKFAEAHSFCKILTVTAGTYSQTVAGGDFKFSGTGFSQTGGTVNLNTAGLQFGTSHWVQTGGTFNAGSGTITNAGGNMTFTAGVFNCETSTVAFTDAGTITGTPTFYKFTFNGTDVIVTIATSITVTNTLTLGGAGQNRYNTGTINAQGNIALSSLFWNGTGTLNINGGTQTLTSTGSYTTATLANVTINCTTLNLVGQFTLCNTITYTAGTVNYGTSQIQIGYTSASIATSLTGSLSLYDVKLLGLDNTITISGGTTLTVIGTTTMHASTGNVSLNTGNLVSQGNIDIISSGSSFQGSAVWTITGTAAQTWTQASTTMKLNPVTINKASGTLTLLTAMTLGNTGQDLAITSGTLDLAGFNLTVADSFVVASAGTIVLKGTETASTPTLNAGSTVIYKGNNAGTTLTMKNWTYKNLTINDQNVSKDEFDFGEHHTGLETLTVTAGTFCMNGFNVTTSAGFTCASGALICMKGNETVGSTPTLASGSTVRYKGDNVANTKTCKNWTYKNLTFNDVNGNLTTFKFGEAHTGIEQFTMTAGIFSQAAGDYAITSSIYNQTGGTFTGGTAALTCSGNWDLSTGTFTSTSGTLTITGNLTHTSGTFTHNSGTVALTGGSQGISGNTTFYTLTKAGSGTTLTLGAGNTQTVANNLSLQGAAGSYMNLRSSTPGTFWKISVPATRTLKYLDFADAQNTAANVYVQDCRRSGKTFGIIFPGF